MNIYFSRRTTLLFGVTACNSASLILGPVPNDISLVSTYRITIGGQNNDVVQVKISHTLKPSTSSQTYLR